MKRRKPDRTFHSSISTEEFITKKKRHSVEKFLYCGGEGYLSLTLMSSSVLVEFGGTGNVASFVERGSRP